MSEAKNVIDVGNYTSIINWLREGGEEKKNERH